MKKVLLVILFAIILVAGCSNNNTEEPKADDQETSNEDVASEENHEDEDNHDEQENREDDSSTEDTDDIESNNDDLKDFPEFDTIAEYIDLDTYQGVLETDNKGNRIIVFQNEKGHSEYKSIFTKHDSHLKIVQFKDDDLLYNGTIK